MPGTAVLAPDSASVLTRAVLRAAEELALSQRELAETVGVSPSTVSRFDRGSVLEPGTKEAELALLLLRAYRSLDALMGGDREKNRTWLRAGNLHLGGGAPADLLRTVTGLVHVVEYLDAMRGHG